MSDRSSEDPNSFHLSFESAKTMRNLLVFLRSISRWPVWDGLNSVDERLYILW